MHTHRHRPIDGQTDRRTDRQLIRSHIYMHTYIHTYTDLQTDRQTDATYTIHPIHARHTHTHTHNNIKEIKRNWITHNTRDLRPYNVESEMKFTRIIHYMNQNNV